MNSQFTITRRRLISGLASVSLVGVLSGADHRRHRTSPRCVDGLPNHPYRVNQPLGGTSTFSSPGILVNGKTTFADIKVFQMTSSSLDFLHTSLSKLSVTIKRDGNWIVSFQADQNPVMRSIQNIDDLTKLDGRGGRLLQTSHLKRNTFHVRFHGLGNASALNSQALIGAPELARIELPPFVVERSTPYSYRNASTAPLDEIKEYFSLIDRFEVDYSIS